MSVRALACRTLIVLAATALAGCPVPIPGGDTHESRQNVGDAVPEFIVIGKTTRADVLLMLGEPDGISEGATRLTYARRTSEGGLLLVLPAGYTMAGVMTEKMTYRRLIIDLDAAGLVASTRLVRSSCRETSSQGVTPPCVSMSGQDLLPGPGAAFQGQIYASAGWREGVRGFDRVRRLRSEPPETPGKLMIGEEHLLFMLPDADTGSEPLLRIEYAQVADVFVDRRGSNRRVVVERSNGTFDSFTIRRDAGSGIDVQASEAAAQLMKGRLRPAGGK